MIAANNYFKLVDSKKIVSLRFFNDKQPISMIAAYDKIVEDQRLNGRGFIEAWIEQPLYPFIDRMPQLKLAH